MVHTNRQGPGRKEKKTFTLSPQSVAFLEALREKRSALSTSAVLEDILQAVRREQEKASIDAAVADYYDSLSREEAQDQANWGEFALGEFPRGRA
jgi:DNA-binding PadR family transcriptional regulator